ncbi:MAG: carboxypeptidase regulatory-like domain-containing protein [Alphaproteobacteria bacterium]|nr:carboxypeptidase regulatory-like domain-containing protein [Alphaproteobacteria bacterium]
MFGSVRDDRGNYVSTALVTIEVAEPVLTYETTTNILGRFRSVDIGRAITDLGYDLDPAQINVSVTAPGYALVRRFNRYSPRRNYGAVEIDFLMTKEK